MAEAYCVKDKQKVEVQNPHTDHDEERQARAAGHLPDLRRQGLPHRRLIRRPKRETHGPRRRRRGPFHVREPAANGPLLE